MGDTFIFIMGLVCTGAVIAATFLSINELKDVNEPQLETMNMAEGARRHLKLITTAILIIIGFVVGGVARGIIVGLLVMITALFFTKLEVQNIPLTLLIVILTATLFSLAGMINAIFANSFDDISIVPTFVLTPLIYLGGVFYSIELLSEFWQGVSKINPILFMRHIIKFD